MKGMSFNQFSGIVLGFILVVFIISIGADVLDSVADQSCDGAGGAWGIYSTSAATSDTGGYIGCCLTINATNPTTACDTWTSTYSTNISYDGLTGTETLGDWMPTIAVVIAAAVVIGILVMYMRFR